MSGLSYTLLTDGSSDSVLMHAVDWVLRKHGHSIASRVWADLRSVKPKPTSFAQRITRASELFPADVLFVHRDAESGDPDARYEEVELAVNAASLNSPWLAVVPIRMTEAWLLHDEIAIRSASGNPNGTVDLNLPPTRQVENVPDPKALLQTALVTSADLNARRRKKVEAKFGANRRRVAELIDDFEPLLATSSFARFYSDVARLP